MADAALVRELAATLPRAYEVIVRDRLKYRVGSLVFLSFSQDDTVLGFAFPKEERADLVASRPDTFAMPSTSDERYNWVHVTLAAIEDDELAELVIDAWRMVVPKRVATAYEATRPDH